MPARRVPGYFDDAEDNMKDTPPAPSPAPRPGSSPGPPRPAGMDAEVRLSS